MTPSLIHSPSSIPFVPSLTSEQDDWDVSEDEKPKLAASTTAAAAPAKKKMSLKQKLAEKERLAAEGVSCPVSRKMGADGFGLGWVEGEWR